MQVFFVCVCVFLIWKNECKFRLWLGSQTVMGSSHRLYQGRPDWVPFPLVLPSSIDSKECILYRKPKRRRSGEGREGIFVSEGTRYLLSQTLKLFRCSSTSPISFDIMTFSKVCSCWKLLYQWPLSWVKKNSESDGSHPPAPDETSHARKPSVVNLHFSLCDHAIPD